MTEERAREADFCDPHLHLALALVVHRERTAVDWVSSRVGVRRGTTAEAYFAKHSGDRPAAMLSESNDELYNALAANQLDVVVDDSPIALHFARETPGLVYAGSLPQTEGAYAIMLRHGNADLRSRINAALALMDADGTVGRLRSQWFHTEEPRVV